MKPVGCRQDWYVPVLNEYYTSSSISMSMQGLSHAGPIRCASPAGRQQHSGVLDMQ